jgi:hypothetical protein
VHQHGLAEREVQLQEERVERGHEDFRHRARVGERHPVRDRHQIARVQHDRLGVAAAAHDPHHALPDLSLGALPERFDRPAELESGDVLRPARRRRILPAALDEIGAVEPRRGDPDADFALPRSGERDLGELEDFRSARLADDDRAHVLRGGLGHRGVRMRRPGRPL